jgi:hypothetical protein
MTYQEVQDRLTKVQSALQSLQNGSLANTAAINVPSTITQLQEAEKSLKERLQILAEEEGIIATDDEQQAEKLAKKGLKVKLTKEEQLDDRQQYIRLLDMFKQLKKSNVSSSSEKYKDLLHKVKKAMDKLGIDSSMIKEMTDQEFAAAGEADRLEKHPEKDKIKKIQALIAAQQKDESIDEEAPEGMYYLEVSVRDARKAMGIMDDLHRRHFEMNGSNVYYFKDGSIAYDAMMDLGAQNIEIVDTNIGDGMNYDDNDNFSDSEIDAYYDDIKEEEQDGGDLDVGHQDDEPNMLKKDLYDIITYASKLYKQLDKYDQHDGEVDFPHWWQKKVILSRDYMSAAQHYLESEEKQPAIDAMALEEGVDEASHAKLKKEYDELVGKMKQLAQHYKTAEGDKKDKIVAALKQHTARKKQLESQLDKAISGIGVGQELDPNMEEAQATGFGVGQGRSKTISKGKESRPDLKSKLTSDEPPFKSSKYVMVKGVPHKMGPDGKLVPLTKLGEDYSAFKNYDDIVGSIHVRFAALEDFVKENQPDMMDDLLRIIADFNQFDEKIAYGGSDINEAKATCCGKCGRVHVKGTECKKPYLTGKKHCKYN